MEIYRHKQSLNTCFLLWTFYRVRGCLSLFSEKSFWLLSSDTGVGMAPFVILLLLVFQHDSVLRNNRPDFYGETSTQTRISQTPHQQHQLQQQQQLQQQKQQQLHLLLSGDVHSHPGPSTPSTTTTATSTASASTTATPSRPSASSSGRKARRVSNPCVVCSKNVTKASKAISCDKCVKWTHVRCSISVSLPTYNECVRNGGEIAFVCDCCSFLSLPFFNNSISDDDNIGSLLLHPPLCILRCNFVSFAFFFILYPLCSIIKGYSLCSLQRSISSS